MSPCLLQVTYDPKVQARSVTLGGDLFDPQGTATGGTKCAIEVSHSCKTPVTCELEYMFYQFGKGSEINALGNTPNPTAPFLLSLVFLPVFICSFCFMTGIIATSCSMHFRCTGIAFLNPGQTAGIEWGPSDSTRQKYRATECCPGAGRL